MINYTREVSLRLIYNPQEGVFMDGYLHAFYMLKMHVEKKKMKNIRYANCLNLKCTLITFRNLLL